MSDIDFSEVEATPQPADGAAPEAETPATPEAPPARTVAALDAVLPDAEDIDEDFRGQPISDVTRKASQWKREAKDRYELGNRVNSLQGQLDMAKQMLSRFGQANQTPAPQYVEPDPQQFLNEFAAAPQRVLPRVVNEQVVQQIEPLRQELQTMRMEAYQSRAELARTTARTASGLEGQQWDALAKPLAAIIWANGGNPQEPEHWKLAYKEYSAPYAQVAPQAQIPRQGQPPVGGARSTASQRPGTPTLSAKDERNLAELADIAGIKKGTAAWTELVKQITSDPSAMGGMSFE